MFQWNFFCLEYDALSRLGITDGRQFLKRRFHKLPVKFLPTCCVGESLQGQVEAAIDEALSSGEWIDILVSVLITLDFSFFNKLKEYTKICLFTLWELCSFYTSLTIIYKYFSCTVC